METGLQKAYRLAARLQRMDVDNVMYNATRDLVMDYKNTLAFHGTIWKGQLMNRMYAKRLGRGVWTVGMPLYGHALDHQRPHYVSLRRGRKIRDWFEDKVGGIPGSNLIYVKPHPFMDLGDAKFLPNLARYARNEVMRVVSNFK